MTDRPRFSGDDLLAELRAAISGDGSAGDADFARLDYGRAGRLGTPEIILAEHKSDEQVLELTRRMLDRSGRVLISRLADSAMERIHQEFAACTVENPSNAQMVRISREGSTPAPVRGRIGVFTGGTSDLPRAEEVRLVAEEMGCRVDIWADVGVAGLHRVIQPFREAIDSGAGAIVVVAGMDGALPSVIAGLSPLPVIGLPTSIGYGYGGGGEAALLSMLQSCAPGLTVVNIDNSVGAGVAAARIAARWPEGGETTS